MVNEIFSFWNSLHFFTFVVLFFGKQISGTLSGTALGQGPTCLYDYCGGCDYSRRPPCSCDSYETSVLPSVNSTTSNRQHYSKRKSKYKNYCPIEAGGTGVVGKASTMVSQPSQHLYHQHRGQHYSTAKPSRYCSSESLAYYHRSLPSTEQRSNVCHCFTVPGSTPVSDALRSRSGGARSRGQSQPQNKHRHHQNHHNQQQQQQQQQQQNNHGNHHSNKSSIVPNTTTVSSSQLKHSQQSVNSSEKKKLCRKLANAAKTDSGNSSCAESISTTVSSNSAAGNNTKANGGSNGCCKANTNRNCTKENAKAHKGK